MGKFAEIYDVLFILKDHSGDLGADPNGDFDLSSKWITFEYDDGFPQSLKIKLNTKGGRFETKAPIIKKWDRIYAKITFKDGTIVEDVFHVKTRFPKQKPGLTMELLCPHQSSNHWTKTISFAVTQKKLSNGEAIAKVIDQLKKNLGAKDPTIEIPATFDNIKKLGNKFSTETANDHIYESKKAESVIDEIKEKEHQPVEGGGSFEPMYVRYKSKYNHSTGLDLDTVILQAFPQGFKENAGSFTNVPSVTLKQTAIGSGVRPSVWNLDGVDESEQGTNLLVICDKVSGTYLRDYSMHIGAKRVFTSAKAWTDGAAYTRGILVNDGGTTFECLAAHTAQSGNRPPSGFWIARTFTKPAAWLTATSYNPANLVRHNDVAYKSLQAHTSSSANEPGKDTAFWVRVNFVPTVDYSPLTKDKPQYWINALAGAKYAATNNARTAMIDPNCIIADKLHPRIPVDYVNTDPSLIPSELLIDAKIPDAFMMLVINPATGAETGLGAFSGNDLNGIPFAGNVAEFVDDDFDGVGFWRVHSKGKTVQDSEIYQWDESISWTKKPCTGIGSYVDGAGVCQIGSRGTVWKKGSYGLSEVAFVGKVGIWFDNKQFECVHSVKWDSSNSRIDCGTKKIMNELDSATSGVFIKSAPGDVTRTFPFYVGFNIHSRWPRTSNAIPFGAVNAGEKIKLSIFDFINMFYTHDAKEEWFGPQVEDYYPIQGIAFMQEFIATHSLFGTFDTEGDYSFGIWLADRRMNQVIIEFNHSRNEAILPVEKKLSTGKTYVGVPGVSAFFSAQEPEIIDLFEPREWLMGGIYTRDSFDSQGRYIGLRSRFNGMTELELALDAYRMTKPLVVTNVDESNNKPDRNIEPQKIKAPGIVLYSQAKNLVLGLEKLLNFERQVFKVATKPKGNISPGDPVYYENPDVISITTDGKPNTIKTVADGIIYTGSKPIGKGPGGLTRLVNLATRVWP